MTEIINYKEEINKINQRIRSIFDKNNIFSKLEQLIKKYKNLTFGQIIKKQKKF